MAICARAQHARSEGPAPEGQCAVHGRVRVHEFGKHQLLAESLDGVNLEGTVVGTLPAVIVDCETNLVAGLSSPPFPSPHPPPIGIEVNCRIVNLASNTILTQCSARFRVQCRRSRLQRRTCAVQRVHHTSSVLRRSCVVREVLQTSDTRSVRHEYEYCDVCVNRSDDNMLDDNFQVSQRLTSDLTTTPHQCTKEMDNCANRASSTISETCP